MQEVQVKNAKVKFDGARIKIITESELRCFPLHQGPDSLLNFVKRDMRFLYPAVMKMLRRARLVA